MCVVVQGRVGKLGPHTAQIGQPTDDDDDDDDDPPSPHLKHNTTQQARHKTRYAQGEEREGVRAQEGDEHDPQRQGPGEKVHGQIGLGHQRLQELFIVGVLRVLGCVDG